MSGGMSSPATTASVSTVVTTPMNTRPFFTLRHRRHHAARIVLRRRTHLQRDVAHRREGRSQNSFAVLVLYQRVIHLAAGGVPYPEDGKLTIERNHLLNDERSRAQRLPEALRRR